MIITLKEIMRITKPWDKFLIDAFMKEAHGVCEAISIIVS